MSGNCSSPANRFTSNRGSTLNAFSSSAAGKPLVDAAVLDRLRQRRNVRVVHLRRDAPSPGQCPRSGDRDWRPSGRSCASPAGSPGIRTSCFGRRCSRTCSAAGSGGSTGGSCRRSPPAVPGSTVGTSSPMSRAIQRLGERASPPPGSDGCRSRSGPMPGVAHRLLGRREHVGEADLLFPGHVAHGLHVPLDPGVVAIGGRDLPRCSRWRWARRARSAVPTCR